MTLRQQLDTVHVSTRRGLNDVTESVSERLCASGLRDVFGMVVRANKTLITPDVYEDKVQRWRTAWPRLTVVGWDA